MFNFPQTLVNESEAYQGNESEDRVDVHSFLKEK